MMGRSFTKAMGAWRTTPNFIATWAIVVGFGLLSANEVRAQRLADWLKLADEAMADGDAYGALRYMEEVMALDSARAAHNYLYAEALRMNHNYGKATYYYNKIYRRDQGKFYPESGAWLATMQKQSGKYAEAKATWRRVRDQYAHEPEGYWHRKAIQEMRSCDLASIWIAETPGFELESLPEGTNTGGSEWAGTVTPGGHLVFSALRGVSDEQGRIDQSTEPYTPRLYVADGPKWDKTRRIKMIPGLHAEANYAVSPDSTLAAVSVIKPGGLQEIYASGGRYGSEWIKLLPANDADTAYYSHPAFGMLQGKEVLFFTSDRDGGEGMLDIWYMSLEEENATPINPGPPVNTPGNDITPFWRKDKEQLYFASDWHHGLGGYDLFAAGRSQGQFAMPQNMGLPWNSPSNDLYYNFGDQSRSGTITSNRPGSLHRYNEGCCNDLWRFEEAAYEYTDTLYIQTLEQLNDYLPVTLFFHNDEPDPRSWSDTTRFGYFDTYYAYLDLLPQYQAEYREGLNPEAGVEAEEAMDRFFIDRVDKGVRDLATFAPLLLQELREGQDIEITVKGFASPLARTDYNVKLTSRRIASLINYLYGYDNGVFRPYLEGTASNGGRLHIVRIPFGEYVAQDFVSDNPNERNAIWSIAAALERKIEISSVQRAQSDTTLATLRFNSEIADLGSVRSSGNLTFSFAFEVVGIADFVLDSLDYDRGAVALDEMDRTYPAGSWGVISGRLTGKNPKGKSQHSVTLYGNVAGKARELNVVVEVVD